MEIYKILICVIPVLLLLNETASYCPEVASSVGQNFMFGVPSKKTFSRNYIFVHITPTSNSPANVRITAPFNNYDQQFTVKNGTYFRLNDTLVQVESGLQLKGIEVSSNVSISVAVVSVYFYSTDGFLALPVTALSTRYVTASYQPAMNESNSVLVVGVENNTDVSIKYKTTGQFAFSFQNFTLQKFETFQLQDSYDLSGSVVVSNKPVAVISGSYQAIIPVGVGNPNSLIEQMIPTKYWTNTFIVPPIYPAYNYIVKILVDKNNTEIHCYNNTDHFAVYLDQGSVYEVMFESDPAVIQANNPISVFQYYSNYDNISGIPFMTTVQGISQFVNSYRFYASYPYKVNDTIALTLPRKTLNGLQLNGKNISSWNGIVFQVSKPMNDYITILINITAGFPYILHHIYGEMFGATIYYLERGRIEVPVYAYGYPLQLSLTEECDAERSTKSSVVSTPSNQITTDFNLLKNNSNGSWCMECDNMLHLQYCDSVTKCGSEHDVCYIQTYARSEIMLAYRSGCMERSKCQNHEGNVHCQHCCEGDFCNTFGCGDLGLPVLDSRGPLCFDCTHKGEEDICQALQMCELGQVCKVEKYKWGSGFHYTMGCVDKSDCSSKRSLNDLQSRNVVACSRCCDSDFCNTNCTINHIPSIIG